MQPHKRAILAHWKQSVEKNEMVMLNPRGPAISIWSRRDILIRTTIVEIRRKFAGSLIGIAWLFLGPVLLMSLYSVVYGVVFKLKPQELSSNEYVIYILSGLVPFLGFSDALMSGANSLAAQRDVLLNSIFPAELVPLRAVLVAFSAPAVGLAVLLVADAAVGHFSLWGLLVPVVVFLFMLFIAGLVWIVSLVNLVLRDIQQILSYVTMIALIASPIAYTPSMLPPGFSVLIWLNPLSYFVISIQSLVVFDKFPPLAAALGCLVLGIGSFAFGWTVFRRAKVMFFDYV
jgi:lipopolysaccharide transport system permease protein